MYIHIHIYIYIHMPLVTNMLHLLHALFSGMIILLVYARSYHVLCTTYFLLYSSLICAATYHLLLHIIYYLPSVNYCLLSLVCYVLLPACYAHFCYYTVPAITYDLLAIVYYLVTTLITRYCYLIFLSPTTILLFVIARCLFSAI
jgi:hypothetical protein